MSKMMVCGKVFLKKLPKSNTGFARLEAWVKDHNLKMPLWQCEALALKVTNSDQMVVMDDMPDTIPAAQIHELLNILGAFQAYQIKTRNKRKGVEIRIKELCQGIPANEIAVLKEVNFFYGKLRNCGGPEVIITEFIFLGSISGLDALWKPKAWLSVSYEDRQLVLERAKELMRRIGQINLRNSNKRKRELGTQHGSEMHFQFYLDDYLPRLKGQYTLLDEFENIL